MTATTASRFDWAVLRENAIASVSVARLPKVIELPALPHAITEFVEKSANPNVDLRVLSAIVTKDSALTVELLKMVNSAAYARTSRVGSVHEAVMIMGVNAVKSHLLAAGVKAASRAIKSRLINQRNFWNESLQRALFAREVARKLKLDPELGFLGGLLQDFLLPVLTNHFDKLYISFLETDAKEGRDLAEWERETFGWDHASAGAYYATQWHFPDELLCAIFFHHSLETVLQDPELNLFRLFPCTLAGLLPDQMRQVPSGLRELIRVDSQCHAIELDDVCQTVDQQQTEMAEGYEIPRQLAKVVEETRRIMEQNDPV